MLEADKMFSGSISGKLRPPYGLAAGVVSVTPYKLGAFGANHALRQTFVFLNPLVMQQPEAYIGGAGELFDGQGNLKNTDTDAFLRKFMTSFGAVDCDSPR